MSLKNYLPDGDSIFFFFHFLSVVVYWCNYRIVLLETVFFPFTWIKKNKIRIFINFFIFNILGSRNIIFLSHHRELQFFFHFHFFSILMIIKDGLFRFLSVSFLSMILKIQGIMDRNDRNRGKTVLEIRNKKKEV